MPQTDWTWGLFLRILVQLVPYVIGIALYSRLKNKFTVVLSGATATAVTVDATVNAPAGNKGDEAASADKTPLIRVDHDHERQQPVDAQSGSEAKQLRLWALVMLPINAAAWYLAIYRWADIDDKLPDKLSDISYGVYIIAVSAYPAIAAFMILVYSMFWTVLERVEQVQEDVRSTLLDGVILAPLSAVWLVAMFPERFVHAGIWMWVGAPVYASQAVVWMLLFLRSRRESMRGGRAYLTFADLERIRERLTRESVGR